jgi:hypothetical protein
MMLQEQLRFSDRFTFGLERVSGGTAKPHQPVVLASVVSLPIQSAYLTHASA